jgi:prevent-host-death family protein
MAAKKRVGKPVEKQGRKQPQKPVGPTRRSSAKAAASLPASTAPHPESGARVFPLAALRAALGTEVDRVRTYGGYTLILRRGRPVAAVIPYEEFERYTMRDSDGAPTPGDRRVGSSTGGKARADSERTMTPQEVMATIEGIRQAIAAEWKASGKPPEAGLSAADLIRRAREERTNQILDAAHGRTHRS